MKKGNYVWIIALLAAAALLGALWQSQGQAQASNGPTEAGWLAFDGQSGPGTPEASVLTTNAQAIDVQASLPGAWVETVYAEGRAYSRLTNDGYGFPAQAGLPELPVLRPEVEIPFGAQVSLELVSATYKDYTLAELGLATLYPMQPSLEKTVEAEQNQQFVIDQGFYTSGSSYPAAPLTLGEAYIVRGHRIQPVEVWPVAYDPAAGTLRLYSQVTFRLVLSGSDLAQTEASAQRYASPLFEASLSQRVLNYNQGRGAVDFAPDTAVGYLIITADAYYDAMLPFVSLRESRGFDVTMTKTSEIPGGTTNANIQTYIRTAYTTWPVPPSYVLLVGDTNTVPTWASVSAGEATDLYYATMDAAGTTDWHPDLGRGRFPVRSPEQTTIMVNKYLAYAGLTGNEPWLNDVSFPATCDNYTVAEGSHNYVINTHTLPGEYWGTFPNNPQAGGDKLYCVTHSAARQNLIDAFNLGRWAIIYSGHGSWSGWEMSFSSTDVTNLTHYGIFPFVASHACISGDFEETQVYGETWVLQNNKGALVFWGSSDSSYWGEDDVLERKMWDALFVAEPLPHPDVWTMTDAGLAAVETSYPSMARYYWETYNILGDPAVKLFLEPDLPTFTLNVDPASHEVCSAGVVTSTVEIGSIQNYTETVYLLTGDLPVNVTAAFNPDQAAAPYTADLALEVSAGAAAGDYTIPLTATDMLTWTQNSSVALRVVTDTPTAPTLSTPADGAANQVLQPQFTWQALPLTGAYAFQLGNSPLFETPLVDVADLAAVSYAPGVTLDGGTCYWWRTSGENACGEGDWAEPFHFSTVALDAIFSDNIESGSAKWTSGAIAGTSQWAVSTAQAHSPTHSWFSPDQGSTTDTYLRLANPVSVGAGSTLTFWHMYWFEGTSYDGSVLEISINGGTSWSDLGAAITSGGYNGTISTCCSNPLGGRQAWTGDLTTWTQVTVNLNAYAGQNILLRWRLGTDSSVSDTGWYIDDVQITAPLPPNPAPGLTTITPGEGLSAHPTPVQISGSNFAGIPALRLGSTWLEDVTVISPTLIEAVVPAGMAPSTYDLVLYNGDCQENTLLGAFTVIFVMAPPDVFHDDAITDEDLAVAIDVLDNDLDPTGLGLSLAAVGAPLHGTTAISGTLALYTPAADFFGTDTFTYTAYNGMSSGGVVTVTVQPVNDAPVMTPESLVIDPAGVWVNQVFTLTGSLTDVDPDDTHTVIITWAPGITETVELPVGVMGFSATHTYALRGAQTISVTVKDASGEYVTIDLIVNVQQTLYVTNLPMIRR